MPKILASHTEFLCFFWNHKKFQEKAAISSIANLSKQQGKLSYRSTLQSLALGTIGRSCERGGDSSSSSSLYYNDDDEEMVLLLNNDPVITYKKQAPEEQERHWFSCSFILLVRSLYYLNSTFLACFHFYSN